MLKSLLFYCFFILLLKNHVILARKRNREEFAVDEEWQGKWFPFPPNQNIPEPKVDKPEWVEKKEPDPALCDDGIHSTDTDFDINNKTHSYHYLCLDNRTLYTPNFNKEALYSQHFIPSAYFPTIKCNNESISYDEKLPTFGTFRLVPPKYGTYTYLPPQRYLHSLAKGSIGMLYHPCAYSGQIDVLANILKSCLYHYFITPSQALTPEYPFALISWGRCLQMSVIDKNIAVNFIKRNAMAKTFLSMNLQHTQEIYDVGLEAEAHLVTDEKDSEICGFQEM